MQEIETGEQCYSKEREKNAMIFVESGLIARDKWAPSR